MTFMHSIRQRRLGRWLGFLLLAIVLIGSGVSLFITLPRSSLASNNADLNAVVNQGFSARYLRLTEMIKTLEETEAKSGNEVVQSDVLNHSLALIKIDVTAGQHQAASNEIRQFQVRLLGWQAQADRPAKSPAQAQAIISVVNLGPAVANGSSPVPIVLYHKTPINFEQQLQLLRQRGYTTITPQDITASFAHRSKLPAKPIVLTFDDGFADDMNAFTLLEKYRMKATFYIVNGGPISNWCIGASRRYNDPSQPIGGCGDAYLNWDQIRQLDQSGLVTIGGHTIDHIDLATSNPDAQRHEIIDSKLGIEQELGHPIYDFAYPYGSYNATSITVVQQAGYTSAVTTLPGLFQDPTQPFTLKRIRDVQSLP